MSRDVARIELGDQAYTISARYNQAPAGVMAIYQLPGSNAIKTARAVYEKMAELQPRLEQEGLDYEIVYDTTPFITDTPHNAMNPTPAGMLNGSPRAVSRRSAPWRARKCRWEPDK